MGWWDDIKNGVKEAASNVRETLVDNGPQILRNIEVGTQGVVKGLASGTASVGDLAINIGYNWTTRKAINLFKDKELEPFKPNLAEKARDAVTWTEARNDTERLIMTGGEVVGEVGAFAVTMVATGGLGGAAVGGSIAVARSTAIGSRVIATGGRAFNGLARITNGQKYFNGISRATANIGRALKTGTSQSFGNSAIKGLTKIFNPVASKKVMAFESAIGLGRGYSIFQEDKAVDQQTDNVTAENTTLVFDDATARQEALNNSLLRASTEIEAVIEELGGDLTDARRTELMEQLDALEEHNRVADELRHENLTEERRTQLWNKLSELDPQLEADLQEAQKKQRSENGASLSNSFEAADAQTNETEQPPKEDNQLEQKQTYKTFIYQNEGGL